MFIAGRYHVHYGSDCSANNYLGDTDGININYSNSAEPINGDFLGDSVISGIHRGGNCFVSVNLLEADITRAAIAACVWPLHSSWGTYADEDETLVGVNASTFLNAASTYPTAGRFLWLTAVSGTPAYTSAVPRQIKIQGAIIAPGHVCAINMSPRLRRLSMRFICLPYTDTGTKYWFQSYATIQATPTIAVPSNYMAGIYDIEWAGTRLGETEDNSIRLEWSHNWEEVRSDAYGDSTIDMLYRGTNVFLQTTFHCESATHPALLKALWPYSRAGSAITDLGKFGTIGTLTTSGSNASTLTLRELTSNAAVGRLQTLTATSAILAPGYDVSLLLSPRLRKVPIRFQLYPANIGTPGSGVVKWFAPSYYA